jgi:ophiobolin F synthase
MNAISKDYESLNPRRLDDIEDSSPLRRGNPATHTVFGPALTINCANYMLIDVMDEVRQLDDPHCMAILVDELRNLFVGQSFDLHWTRQSECPSEEEYLEMVSQSMKAPEYLKFL